MSKGSILVITGNILNAFNAEILWAMEDEFVESGYTPVVYSLRPSQVMKKTPGIIKKMINDPSIKGIVVVALPVDDETAGMCAEKEVPLVLVENHAKGANTIRVDNERGGFDAMKYIIEKGYKKTGVVTGDVTRAESQKQRMEGCSRAVEKEEGVFKDNIVFTIQAYSFEEGRKAFRYMVMNEVDSIFCIAGDYVAYGVITEAKNYSIPVPGQVGVMGFDDIETSAAYGLTTVRQPADEMGREAFKTIVKAIEKPGCKPVDKVLKTELVIRDTI